MKRQTPKFDIAFRIIKSAVSLQCDKDNRYKRKKQIDMYLENIYSPEDVKKLSIEELNKLSGEIRAALLQKLSEHGGHFGPNLR